MRMSSGAAARGTSRGSRASGAVETTSDAAASRAAPSPSPRAPPATAESLMNSRRRVMKVGGRRSEVGGGRRWAENVIQGGETRDGLDVRKLYTSIVRGVGMAKGVRRERV